MSQRIILFGSYAYGRPTVDSDVDLMILMHGKHVHDIGVRIRDSVDFGFPVDLVVRSPEEFDRRINWGDDFLREIQNKGKVLYEASDARVDQKGRGRLQNRRTRTSRTKVAKLR